MLPPPLYVPVFPSCHLNYSVHIILVVIALASDKHFKFVVTGQRGAGDRVVIPTIHGTSFCDISTRIYLGKEKVVSVDT